MLLINAITSTLMMILELYKWIIIIAALLTWVRPDPHNPIVQFLYGVTEPLYAYIRRFIPTTIGGIDLAPIIVLFAIFFFQQILRGI